MTPVLTERPGRTRRPPPSAPLDAVTRYAKDVLAGRIVAGRMVRLACQRHLDDLARQRTERFPFWFNRDGANHVIEFFAEYLTLEDGAPFLLTPAAAFVVGSFFGWRRVSDDGRRFSVAYECTGKGSGKSPKLAGIGLYVLRYDNEPAAEVYVAAFDKGQAEIPFRDARRMAETSPRAAEMGLTVDRFNIAHLPSRSFFRVESSETRNKSGPRPHFVLIEELHEHRDRTVVTKMRAGFKRRRQPGLFCITNAGFDRTSICWEYHEHSMKVLEGAVVDEQWFAFICQLDPCEPCRADGYWQPNPGCDACDNWKDPAVWPKANPSLAYRLPTRAYLQSQVDSTAIASNLATVMQLNFGIWTSSRRVWITTDRWDACQVAAITDGNPDARPAAAGADLSATLDLTSLVVALRFDDPPSEATPEVVEIAGRDDAGQATTITLTLNFHVELVPYFWIPEATLLERVRTERIPYDLWRTAGKIEATRGAVIDHQVVYEKILWARKHFKLQRLGMDQHNATMMFVKLRDEGRFGKDIVAVGQGKKLSEAFKLIEILVASRRLRHDGHPVLAWNIANAEPQRDRIGALWIEKPTEVLRIDGAVAAAMAIQQLMILPAKRPSGARVIVV